MFHEEQDTQTGSLEADNEREQREATSVVSLSNTARSALRYRPISKEDVQTHPPQRASYKPQNPQRRNVRPHLNNPYPFFEEDDEEEATPSMRQSARKQAAQLAGNTDEDEQVAPSLRGRQTDKAHVRQRRGKHPLFWLGTGAAAIILAWEALTWTPGWITTTFIDPSQFGPAHGNIITMALGNGDSAIAPSVLLATNVNGQVSILKLFSGDPKKNTTFTGPNLAIMNFPDASKAQIELVQEEPGKITVRIWSDEWDRPFHRYGVAFFLEADGKGGLKQVSGVSVL